MKKAWLYGVYIEYPITVPFGKRYMDIKDKPMAELTVWHIVGRLI